MPSKKQALTDKEIDAIFAGLHNPEQTPWENWRRFARAIEMESRERCAKICLDVYNRTMAEWRDDGHRYNLGYAHGADECMYAMTGRTVID